MRLRQSPIDWILYILFILTKKNKSSVALCFNILFSFLNPPFDFTEEIRKTDVLSLVDFTLPIS
ncbi:hypothetical protein BVRB_2g026630 [Beta vulgaris subsp. vulgaris]|nr:hypothetical protein BVRB_2g026630 [Beta vulgaris subsp. vulgaris]